MNAITSAGLVVRKGAILVLDSLSFTIERGTITGLIGPSGSGKTTLMRAIVGVQSYEGKLTVLGYATNDKQLRKRVGYVTQSPAIYGDLTVKQNIAYFATITNASKSQVDKVIKTVDLAAQKNQLAGSLSGGQKARVSLAIALLGEPELLVLDEPTVGVDPILRNHLWGLFGQLAKQGKTLLVSSHVMDEADRCEQLLLIRDGVLLWHDGRRSLLNRTGTHSVGEAFVSMIMEAS